MLILFREGNFDASVQSCRLNLRFYENDREGNIYPNIQRLQTTCTALSKESQLAPFLKKIRIKMRCDSNFSYPKSPPKCHTNEIQSLWSTAPSSRSASPPSLLLYTLCCPSAQADKDSSPTISTRLGRLRASFAAPATAKPCARRTTTPADARCYIGRGGSGRPGSQDPAGTDTGRE
jgi:hypothetical protein